MKERNKNLAHVKILLSEVLSPFLSYLNGFNSVVKPKQFALKIKNNQFKIQDLVKQIIATYIIYRILIEFFRNISDKDVSIGMANLFDGIGHQIFQELIFVILIIFSQDIWAIIFIKLFKSNINIKSPKTKFLISNISVFMVFIPLTVVTYYFPGETIQLIVSFLLIVLICYFQGVLLKYVFEISRVKSFSFAALVQIGPILILSIIGCTIIGAEIIINWLADNFIVIQD
ncbi:hypothetical protein U6A24_17575 [Aquimarina gracilis]|uniref:Yip1-like protein n=1 Tax=Aquimarina gracilis TaxID=874422 RepID=A0ABU5ZZI5_9FLAO|nr:hypothetical protein [Aquimarina gracilis]MEB3347290.1 hypothetical protein [Aquimarina gracilis]